MSYDESGMELDLHESFRRLVASEPKQARAEFQRLLRLGAEAVEPVLNLASRPGEGRLRQMIATVFRIDTTAVLLEPWLRRWLEVESDEFTKNALENALGTRSRTSAGRRPTRASDTHTLEAYQFVSSRLCHSIRNAMSLPNAQISKLKRILAKLDDEDLKADLAAVLEGLQTGFLRISRTVEFDTGDDYLVWQSIQFISWIQAIETEFNAKLGPAKLTIICDPAVRRAKVRASRFLLETIFSNLWSNAVQVIDGLGPFVVEVAVDWDQRLLDLIISDGGPGFPEGDMDTAFQQTYSTKSQFRGRGLLEVADAVNKLGGKVELRKRTGGDYRIGMVLPLEGG